MENAKSEIEPVGGKPEEIKAFLKAMLPGKQRVAVNRELLDLGKLSLILLISARTVIAVTKLAHRYDVEFLLADCERSLKMAHEIPMVERLLLADQLQLHDVLVGSQPKVIN